MFDVSRWEGFKKKGNGECERIFTVDSSFVIKSRGKDCSQLVRVKSPYTYTQQFASSLIVNQSGMQSSA